MNGRWKTMKEYDSLSDNEKRNMLASVANLYYNVEMTQNQIAERFFTSRSKISRMLKEARQLGIVEIKILEPWDRNVELEQEFMRRFALKDVRVISVKEANNTMVLQKLGEVAAYYLDNLLNDNMILGSYIKRKGVLSVGQFQSVGLVNILF